MRYHTMRKISITLTNDEIDGVIKFLPMLQPLRHLIPKDLVSVVSKVERAINEDRNL